MKSEFLIAITQLSAEKNLPREVVFAAVEAALASAYKKDPALASQNLAVRINPTQGEVHVFSQRVVVESPQDPKKEISLSDAQKLRPSAELGEVVEVEITPKNAGRIAAQTAKQVVLQRLREAERDVTYEEYSGREGDIISAVITRVEPRQVVVNLGKTEGVLPPAEQVRGEHYRVGQRLKVYLVEVQRSAKGPRIIVSRTHPQMLRRLLELEVPELAGGRVEIKGIAREAGSRSKVAVTALQEGIDPVGACVGLRGIRIQNVVNELGGERIDVVQWHPNIGTFIGQALSPAQVTSVEVRPEDKSALVVVPDRQLSLAIGKEGQNARLAAKLTGWRIDIKGLAAAETERTERLAAAAAVAEAQALVAAPAPVAEVPAPPPAAVAETPAPEPVKAKAAAAPVAEAEAKTPEAVTVERAAAKKAGPAPAAAELVVPALAPAAPAAKEEKAPAGIRFAEEVLAPLKTEDKPRRKGKEKVRKGAERGEWDEAAKVKSTKGRRQAPVIVEEELENYDLEVEEKQD
ncbi:MAG: transcription termination/antitermination protein NusA [Chloroflexi bacterium]|nr:transcription termination/antitermination protein NusA [Chloroflexota bacterium]